MAEYIVAIDVTRVRFPADAQFGQNWRKKYLLPLLRAQESAKEYASTLPLDAQVGPDRKLAQRIACPSDDRDGLCRPRWTLGALNADHAQPIAHDIWP